MLIFLILKECVHFLFILLSIIIFFFCLYLYFNNKKLKERISKLEIETKEILERKLMKENPNDLVSLQVLSNDSDYKKVSTSKVNKKNCQYQQKNNYNKAQSKQKETQYQKDNIKTQIPIFSKENNKNYKQKCQYNFSNINNEKFNIEEFIQKESQKITKHTKSSADYLDEISNKIKEELSPKTIELTDYEKKQEEQAVISYKELLALKDRLQNNSDTDENINFIENLKDFRNNLNK